MDLTDREWNQLRRRGWARIDGGTVTKARSGGMVHSWHQIHYEDIEDPDTGDVLHVVWTPQVGNPQPK